MLRDEQPSIADQLHHQPIQDPHNLIKEEGLSKEQLHHQHQ